jgi:4-alpha-glucanotransferase
MSRHVGVNVPLFSLRSSTSWGIGGLTDVKAFVSWLAAAGFDRLLILPIGCLPPGETSPYAPSSTMAIDPMLVDLESVPDFVEAGGRAALSREAHESLEAARAAPVVRRDLVQRAKAEALDRAFEAFVDREWTRSTVRAGMLAAYVAREDWWLDDYALFQTITAAHAGARWRDWPAALRDREATALERVRQEHSREMLRHQYWQWLADGQWQDARAAASVQGVSVIGDLPFTAGPDSADVWARAGEYELDVSVGVPPDAFSPDGQNWGLPAYRWEALAASGYAWMRLRARRMAALFDGMRVDHVVGLYRTYGHPAGGHPFFSPPGEAAQRAQGEAVLTILGEAGARLIAEDLGTIPDFVRESLAALDIPGCRVMRWERQWHTPGQPFIDPRSYPASSAAMTGTHDTEPLAVWWEEATDEERDAALALDFCQVRPGDPAARAWTADLRDAYLRLAYAAGSAELFLPVQDLFGWRDRINTPGTVGAGNWTWCLPWPVDRWDAEPEARDRAAFLEQTAGDAGRGSGR